MSFLSSFTFSQMLFKVTEKSLRNKEKDQKLKKNFFFQILENTLLDNHMRNVMPNFQSRSWKYNLQIDR